MSPSTRTGAPLVLTTLGDVALRHAPTSDGTPGPVIMGAGKPLLVLTYLALSPERSASRDHLLDLFWADLSPERGQHSLRQMTWMLRQHLGEEALVSAGSRLRLNLPLVIDRELFLDAVARGQLEEAVKLYTGDFFPDFASPGGVESEHWMDQERQRLRTVFVRAAEELARSHLSGGRYREALDLGRRVREAEPGSERAWRLVIECLLQIKRTLAIAEADELERLLANEYRVASPATAALLRLVRQTPPSDVGVDDAGLATQMVGREAPFAQLLEQWQKTARGASCHLHLSAPAGVGKTRLIGEVATRLRTIGATVVSLRAAFGERGIGYAFAAEVARAIATLPGSRGIAPASAATLVGLAPMLSSSFPVTPDTASGQDALRRRTLALSEMVHAAAEERPFALLIDDVHWADESSVQILLGMLDRLGSAPVMVITSSRPVRGLAIRLEQTHAVELFPLSVADTETLLVTLGALPKAPWAAALPIALHAASGGVPLLILETVRLALEQGTLTLGAEGWSCPAPALLEVELHKGSALEHRLEQIDRDSRWLLMLLATAGTAMELGTLARAADRPGEAVEFTLGLLERRGFVQRVATRWEPAHDEIAEAVRHLSAPDVEVAAHTAIGVAMAFHATDRDTLLAAGRHLARGHHGSDLNTVFTRWVRDVRTLGDLRSAHELAADFVGGDLALQCGGRLVAALPWRLRWARGGRRTLIATGVAMLALGVVAGTQLHLGPGPEMSLLLHQEASPAIAQDGRIDLRITEWDGRQRLAVRQIRSPVAAPPEAQRFSLRPNGREWLYDRDSPGGGDRDLYLIDAAGSERRLSTAPGDELEGSWSPDGAYIVATTFQWNAEGRSNADLGVLDLATGQWRQLTAGSEDDGQPFWSPDGTRIAFRRISYERGTMQLCWVTADGANPHCRDGLADSLIAPLGWLDARTLAVTAHRGAAMIVLRLNADDGALLPLSSLQVTDPHLSPDGRWLASIGHPPDRDRSGLWLLPTERPTELREIDWPSDSVSIQFLWQPGADNRTGIARLQASLPTVVSVGVPALLGVNGLDSANRLLDVPPAVVRWSALNLRRDTTPLPDGVLRIREPGQIRLSVSAGGWRMTDTIVTVVPASSPVERREQWGDSLSGDWIAYGDPPVRHVSTPLGAALWLAGDDDGTTGVVRRTALPAAQGLGVEARLSLPIKDAKAQLLELLLTAGIDSNALKGVRSWKDVPQSAFQSGIVCTATYPGGDTRVDFSALKVYAAGNLHFVKLPTGRRLPEESTLLLQIFPDGTCGLALNGEPLWRSATRVVSLDRPYRVAFRAMSADTHILVREVSSWSGVTTRIPWGGLAWPPRK